MNQEEISMKTVYMREIDAQYENYRRAVKASGGNICSKGDPLHCDALLLPGGGDMEPRYYGQFNTASRSIDPQRDIAEMDLLELFTTAKKPILGICRGLQIINVFFGGTLIQDIPGHSNFQGIDRLHRIYTTSSPLRNACKENSIVNSSHHQAVNQLGAGLLPLQWSPDGVVEALQHQTLPILALQWHPERLMLPHGQQVFNMFLSESL